MKMTFRWFGEGFDPIPLGHIRQIPGMTGIMGVLDQYAARVGGARPPPPGPAGRAAAAGLECKVIESVNVHEDIKLGGGARDEYIANYCTTLENLAEYGVEVVIYNFMPVFDWLRTELYHETEDGSTCLYYNHADVEGMTPLEIVERTARDSGGFTLPGWEPDRLSLLEEVLARYEGMTADQLRENYRYFLEGVIPTCERVGIRMAVHPDDPAWELFGIPRICNSRDDLDRIVRLVDSEANSLCVCSGSLGSDPANDVPAIFREFGERGRIAAAHVRNVKHLGDRHFREAAHLSSDGSLDMEAIVEAIHDTCPDVYVRPDHGRMIWGETGRPGYPLYDRALGAVYLNGLYEAVSKLKARA